MDIAVFGMGYVGVVTAAAFAAQGNRVTGVDVSNEKVALVNDGKPPVLEPDLPELVSTTTREGLLRATTDASEALKGAEVIFICVGTPSAPNGSLNCSHVLTVCRQIGEMLSGTSAFPVVVVRSTVLPDAVEASVVPALEEGSGRKIGRGYGLAVNPEFLREGTSLRDFHHPRFTLVGTDEDETAAVIERMYGFLDAPFLRTDRRTAPMVKYASNAYHALKVAFANEIGALSESVGADGQEVMELFCKDTELNISRAYLRPGMPFGGSCLPKDVRALAYYGRVSDVEVPLLQGVLRSNRAQTDRCLRSILSYGRKRVGMFGLSFKAGTDDLRESPLVELVEALLGKGLEVSVYDGRVSLASLMGTNRAYVEQHIPHIARLLKASVQEVLDEVDIVVIGNGDSEFGSIAERMHDGQILIDLTGRTANGSGGGLGHEGRGKNAAVS